jgi:hypothetical protein
MNARPRSTLLLLTLVTASITAESAGQTVTPSGEAAAHAPTVLQVAPGTRAIGFGDAWVAGDGPEVVFYNPAQIGTRGSTFSLGRFGGGATLGTLATAGRIAGNSVSIGVRYLDYGAPVGGFPMPAGRLPVRGAVDGTSFDALVAAQKSWYGVRFGGAAHYAAEQQAAGRASGMLFDAGASKAIAGFSLGVSVQNLGSDFVLGGVPGATPRRVTAGAMRDGISIGPWLDLAVAAAISEEDGGRVVPKGGAELSYEPVSGWTFVGRVGYQRPDLAAAPGARGLSLGASFGLDALSVDYAWQAWRGGGGGVHRIGLRIQ